MQRTACELRISDCSSDVCSSDLQVAADLGEGAALGAGEVVGEGGLQFRGGRAGWDRVGRLGATGLLALRHGQLVSQQLVKSEPAAMTGLRGEIGRDS